MTAVSKSLVGWSNQIVVVNWYLKKKKDSKGPVYYKFIIIYYFFKKNYYKFGHKMGTSKILEILKSHLILE